MVVADSNGSAIVSMTTNSANLPVSQGALQPQLKGGQDIYVAKISPDGSRLLGAIYLGGSGDEYLVDGHSVDRYGNIYVSFCTKSNDIPVTPDAIQREYKGNADIYFANVSDDFKTLLYGTYLGGSGTDDDRCTHVDMMGNIYIVGDTTSTDFPITRNAFQPLFSGGENAFVTKFFPARAPSVSLIVSPTSYAAQATVTVNASVNAYSGKINKVDFFANSVLVGTSNASPYRLTSMNVRAGGYFLSAIVAGDTGGTSTSDNIEITVKGAANLPPVIITPALSNGNPVNAPWNGPTTSRLSVLAVDDGGEAKLTYTWSILDKPSGAPDPTFSINAENAAKNCIATYRKAGDYTFNVTAKDEAGLMTSSAVKIKVARTHKSITISPINPTVKSYGSVQFTAVSRDQFGDPFPTQPQFLWSSPADGGKVTNEGLFTAGTAPGTFSVTVITDRAGMSTSSTNVKVIAADNQPPTIVTPASVTVDPALNKYTLNVLGATESGEANLSYTWGTSGTLSGPVVFGAGNGTNKGKSTTATFSAAGTYTLVCMITDPAGLSVTSSVNVKISPVLTKILLNPSSSVLANSQTKQFAALATDQFGNFFQPAINWTINPGGIGEITSNGIYKAPSTGSGKATIRATIGDVSNTATVIFGEAPRGKLQ